MKFTLQYENNAELDRKLKTIMERRGFHVSPIAPERISVAELARRVGRPVPSVSKSLRSLSCPSFERKMGVRRILWLEPNDRLLSYLQNPPLGGRPTNPPQTTK